MKKFKILPLAIILLLAISLLPVSALAVTDPSISARAAVLMDANTGEIFFKKNADEALAPSSTTKVMTALLAIEAIERGEISLSDSVSASGNVSVGLTDTSSDSSPRIVSGETLTVEELLYCILLISADDAANMLAEYLSGSVSAFVDDMNDRAAELGCENTHFSNCTGADAEDHYSTAMDLALITREALRHRLFQTVSGTLYHTVSATNAAAARELTNTNSLINNNSEYYYDPAYGVKTGYSATAGYCLISAAKQNNINAICILMGGKNVGDQFSESATLYRWLYNNFESTPIVNATTTILTIPVKLGTQDTVGVRAENGVTIVLPYDFDLSRVSYEYILYHEQNGEELNAPVSAGQLLGELTVVELDENRQRIQTYGTARLVAASSVDVSRTEYLQSQVAGLLKQPVIMKILKILAIVLAVYLLLVIIYFFQRIHHLRTLRKAKRARARHQAEEDAQWLSIPEAKTADPEIGYFNEPAHTPQLQEPARQKTTRPKAVKTARTVSRPVPVGTGRKADASSSAEPRREPEKPASQDTAAAPSETAQAPGPKSPAAGTGSDGIFDDSFFDTFFKT